MESYWFFRCATVLSLCTIFSEVVGFDYCKTKCGLQHTMCKYPGGVSKKGECAGKEVKAGVDQEMRDCILRRHNDARMKASRGEYPQLPKSSDMMKLRWSPEAEKIAQRWADQCHGGGDDCRSLEDGTEVGQNTWSWSSGEDPTKYDETHNSTDRVSKIVDDWMGAISYFKSPDVDEYGKGGVCPMIIGKVTQLFWAKTLAVGCGYREERKPGSTKGAVFCNYVPTGNVYGVKMMTRGEPCSACPPPTACSSTYPGLCLAQGDDDSGATPLRVSLFAVLASYWVSAVLLG